MLVYIRNKNKPNHFLQDIFYLLIFDYYYYEIDKEDNTKILGPFIYNDLVYFLAKKYDKEKYYQEYKNNNTYFTFTSIDEIMKGR